jgi:hypothetical protein
MFVMAEKKIDDKMDQEADATRGEAGISADKAADVCEAAAYVEQAREQLRVAEAVYHQLREKAGEKIKQVRGTSVGDAMDTVLRTTKKHPVPCLLAAGFLGFLLGRLFRR